MEAGVTPSAIGTFRVNVTPPVGSPLCAGWYSTAVAVADPLYASGIVLVGDEAPVVLCALDFAELSNRSHIGWRERLATAAGTTPDRVALHCTHAHCTPWPDREAERIAASQPGMPHVMDAAWCAETLERIAETVHDACRQTSPLTHIAIGEAAIEKVASSRRILGEDGTIRAVRYCKTRDLAIRAEPEGLIDCMLKSVSFWEGDRKCAVLHYYAVHPASCDSDRTITSEFVGLARDRRMQAEPDVLHVYFTGCAGNVTPGKYNDGSIENRPVLAGRIHDAMQRAEASAARSAVGTWAWRTAQMPIAIRQDRGAAWLRSQVEDDAVADLERLRAAIQLATLERADVPIPVTALHLGRGVVLLHLPAEAFIEYQLFAQQQRPGTFVCTAAYGDCGPGYICMEHSHDEGGYEPTDAFCAPRSEWGLKEAIRQVLSSV